MGRTTNLLSGFTVLFAVACGTRGEAPAAQADTARRSVALAPAESTARPLNDRPATQTAEPTPAKKAPARKAPPPPPRDTATPKPAPPPAPEPPAPSLAAGTRVSLTAVDSIHSRHNNKGDPVMATVSVDVKDSLGRTVIPAGAVLVGRVSDIDAGHPGSPGRLVITFNRAQFGGKSYSIVARVDSMATVEQGRAIQATDAAKVGAGAVLGGIVGRLIGGNKTGTLVGGAAGAAAGAGVAAKTRDVDVVLPAGALVRVTLTAPFDRKEIQ